MEIETWRLPAAAPRHPCASGYRVTRMCQAAQFTRGRSGGSSAPCEVVSYCVSPALPVSEKENGLSRVCGCPVTRVGEEALMAWVGNPVPSTQTAYRSSEGRMCMMLLLARCLFFFTKRFKTF